MRPLLQVEEQPVEAGLEAAGRLLACLPGHLPPLQVGRHLLAYLVISLLYRFVLTGLSPAQQSFEKVATTTIRLLARSLDTLTLLTSSDTLLTLC